MLYASVIVLEAPPRPISSVYDVNSLARAKDRARKAFYGPKCVLETPHCYQL